MIDSAPRVFISYSSRDRPDALRVREIAEAAGHRVWMDVFDIEPATRVASELERGVTTADVLCVLLSPSAVASPWVQREVESALAAQAGGLRLMPVLLRPARVPDELADLVAVDATRGLDDAGVELRLRRAFGGDVADGVLLDAVRRAELADRAAVEAAEQALPALRDALARVLGDPIHELVVTIDQDTWPADRRDAIEIELTLGLFGRGPSILLAPYVEGHTWWPEAEFDERPAEDFFREVRPRVDARLRWAGRTVTGHDVIETTGERPVALHFSLPGDELSSDERGRAGFSLVSRFELPSLRELIDGNSEILVWTRSPGGGEPEPVDPDATDLRLRVEVSLNHDRTGLYGFRMWSHHDRLDRVLLSAPTLRGAATDIEREALLSQYRNEALRAEQTSSARWDRIDAALAGRAALADEDRWMAFAIAAGRADVPRLRGQLVEASLHLHQGVEIVVDDDPATFDYSRAFRLLTKIDWLVSDLSRAGGSTEVIARYADVLVDLPRRLVELHPEEPDYRRALARHLVLRARLFGDATVRVDDVNEAVAIVDALVREDPLPWRVDEARELRRVAEAVLEAWSRPLPEAEPQNPDVAREPAVWLDPERVEGTVFVVIEPLLRFVTGLPPELRDKDDPRLSLQDGALVAVWGDGASSLVAELAEKRWDDEDRTAADLAAGRPPGPLPGTGTREVVAWHEEPLTAPFLEDLAAETAHAFRFEVRDTAEGTLQHCYALTATRDELRWRFVLTLQSTEDWRARARDDGRAAMVFGRLRLS